MDYTSILNKSLTAAFELATSTADVPVNTEQANAFAARIQSLLEVAKIAGALGAANDAIAANAARAARTAPVSAR